MGENSADASKHCNWCVSLLSALSVQLSITIWSESELLLDGFLRAAERIQPSEMNDWDVWTLWPWILTQQDKKLKNNSLPMWSILVLTCVFSHLNLCVCDFGRAGRGGQPPGERHQDAVVGPDRVRSAHDPGTQRRLQGESGSVFPLLPAVTVCLSVEVDFRFLSKEIENKNISSTTVFHTSCPVTSLLLCPSVYVPAPSKHQAFIPCFCSVFISYDGATFLSFLLTPFGVFFVKPLRFAALFVSWHWSEAPLSVLCLSLSLALC